MEYEVKKQLEYFLLDGQKPIEKGEEALQYETHTKCPFCKKDHKYAWQLGWWEEHDLFGCVSCYDYHLDLTSIEIPMNIVEDQAQVHVYFVAGTQSGWAYRIKFEQIRFELDSWSGGGLLFDSKRMATLAGIRDAYKNLEGKW